MPFLGQNMTPIGGNARSGAIVNLNAPMGWAYQSQTDIIAVVTGIGYFDTFNKFLQVGHFIYLNLPDGKFIATVNAVDKILNTVTLDGNLFIPQGIGGVSSLGGYTFEDAGSSQTVAVFNVYEPVDISAKSPVTISDVAGWTTDLSTGIVTRTGATTNAMVFANISLRGNANSRTWAFKIALDGVLQPDVRTVIGLNSNSIITSATFSINVVVNNGQELQMFVAQIDGTVVFFVTTDMRMQITDS